MLTQPFGALSTGGSILAFSVRGFERGLQTMCFLTNDLEYTYLPNTSTTELRTSGCGHRWHRRPSAVTQSFEGVFTGVHLRHLGFPYRNRPWNTDHVFLSQTTWNTCIYQTRLPPNCEQVDVEREEESGLHGYLFVNIGTSRILYVTSQLP